MHKVLSQIKPSIKEQEQFRKTTALFLQKLQQHLKDSTVFLGGSGAKGTWLSGNYDIDIFAAFAYKKYAEQSAELSEFLERALKKAFPSTTITRLHGSRDYFQLQFKKLNFEVVPILNIKKVEQARNITDISPFHSQWVNQNAQKVKDQILLAKQFCKAQKMYGAESYISGFSGYVLEILVTYYGSFEKLLRASLQWKEKEVIDPAKHYKTRELALFHINSSKLQSPLVVVDPVDKARNAAAALSLEKVHVFQQKAKEYLRQPAAAFFTRETFTLAALQKKAGTRAALIFSVVPLEGKEDVIGIKLWKVFQYLQKELHKFEVVEADWDWQPGKKALMYIIVKKRQLPAEYIHAGPPLKLKEHVAKFQQQHHNTFEKKGYIFAKIREEYPLLGEHVKVLVKDPYVQEKVKTITVV